MITVNDISVQFGGTTLALVAFCHNENDKIALMGKMEQENRLLKIIAGQSKRLSWYYFGTKDDSSLFASAFIGY
jgi:ATPase subunit of ABC transporter with duplicated ATPase domains